MIIPTVGDSDRKQSEVWKEKTYSSPNQIASCEHLVTIFSLIDHMESQKC
jgi:hypothetical protein